MSWPAHPTFNAVLNFSSAVLLAMGFYFIKKKNIPAHRAAMTAAFLVSTVFLVSYLVYHATAGVTRYSGTGLSRAIYLLILLTHTVLAALVAPLAITTFLLARRGRFEAHRRLARYTWPVWMYVSVTGVVIYWMLYRR